jgi:hypothetical protein
LIWLNHDSDTLILSKLLLPEGFGGISPASPSSAAAILVWLLYKDQPLPKSPVSDIPPLKADRNQEIYNRYMAGERAIDLAMVFGISVRRINKIIRRIQHGKDD